MPRETNWAGNLAYAGRIEHPASTDAVRELLRNAPGPIRPLGTRHTFNGLADTPGTLIATDRMPAVIEPDAAAGSVRVSGGIRYGDLAPVLAARGLALANLASLPHISVAGAVATGTHGSGDRTGSLATAVNAIELIAPDGASHRLVRGDADFDGAVVSLGALGVVTALELDVEPAYEVSQTVFEAPSWDGILAEFDAVTALATSVSIFTRWRRGDVADQLWLKQRMPAGPAPSPLLDRLGARPATEARHPILGMPAEAATEQFGRPGPWHERLPHFRLDFTPSAGDELQSEYLVPRTDAVAAIKAVRGLAARLAPVLLVNEVRTVAGDGLWLSPAYGADAVALHFTWRRDPASVAAVLPLVEAALPASARPHWGKVFTLPGEAVAARYPRWSDFAALRERFDPAGRLRNAFLRALGV